MLLTSLTAKSGIRYVQANNLLTNNPIIFVDNLWVFVLPPPERKAKRNF